MRTFLCFAVAILFINCKNEPKKDVGEKENATSLMAGSDTLIYDGEKHFKSIRQITFGGDNAEAYWSFDDNQMIFQSNNEDWGLQCDQMFLMDVSENFKDKNLL